MHTKTDPEIESVEGKLQSFTQISFIPDYDRF
jgi:hypothetical protein